MIYTSCFGRIKAIQAADPSAVFVAVCGGLPAWWSTGQSFRWLRKVAPKWEWWNEWHKKFEDNLESDESKRWYGEKYRKTVLDKLDPAGTLAEIEEIAGGSNAYLLCYEAPNKFCHRHMLAAWLNLKNGTDIREWERYGHENEK